MIYITKRCPCSIQRVSDLKYNDNEPVSEKNNTLVDTIQAVQSQKQARSLNFGFKKKKNCTIYAAKTKALISSAGTEQLICTFFRIGTNPVFSLRGCNNIHYKDIVMKYTENFRQVQIFIFH